MSFFQKLQPFFRENSQSNLFKKSFLAYLVLSSKNFLLYNEETLVLISFIAFVFFSLFMMSHSIESSLNERSLAISQELENSLQTKDHYIHEIFHEHEKQSCLKELFQKFYHSSSKEISTLHHYREKSLHGTFFSEIFQKIQGVFGSSQTFQETLQKTFGLGFRASVGETFFFQKKIMKSTLLFDALRDLKVF